jgi:hypothetical protein
MARTKRKSNGCRRGKFKRKPMGKGWAAHRRVPVPEIPKNRKAEGEGDSSSSESSSNDS